MLVVAIALMVIGPALGVTLIVTWVSGATSAVAQAPSHPSGETAAEIALTAGTPTGVWVIGEADPQCRVADPTLHQVEVRPVAAGVENVSNSHLRATFTPASDGTYTVTCDGDTAFEFKVTSTIHVGALIVGIVVGAVAIAGFMLAGVALLIVALLRRSGAIGRPAATPGGSPMGAPPTAG
jgi:hypothetical protein